MFLWNAGQLCTPHAQVDVRRVEGQHGQHDYARVREQCRTDEQSEVDHLAQDLNYGIGREVGSRLGRHLQHTVDGGLFCLGHTAWYTGNTGSCGRQDNKRYLLLSVFVNVTVGRFVLGQMLYTEL